MQSIDTFLREIASTYPSLFLLLILIFAAGGIALSWRLGKRNAADTIGPELESVRRESERWQNEADVQKQARMAQERRAEQYADALASARSENAALQGRLELVPRLEANVTGLQDQLTKAEQRHAQAQHARGRLEARLVEQQRSGEEKLALLERAREELRQSFAGLANDILEEKSKRFGQQNVEQIGQLLTPMREQLKEFEEVVRAGHGEEKTQRSLLLKELDNLRTLNTQLSDEATHLTRALRGDNKMQGNWGEVILERLLEMAGLTEGREYERQEVLKSEVGGAARPDVVIHLPEDRALVVDSKVSLISYDRAVSSNNEDERKKHLNTHVVSLRRHVQGLSERSYDQLLGSKSLDMVLMFVPVEGAFIDAIRTAPDLYEHALERRVIVVSPTTLLATLKAVHHVWRQEQRNTHAEEIAHRAAKLYDKLVGFVGDLELARGAVRKADGQLDEAFNKLSQGRNNLIRQAERLRDLGVEPSKKLPPQLIDAQHDEDDEDDSSPGLLPA